MNTIKINRVTYEVGHDRFDIWLVNPEKIEETIFFPLGYNTILQSAFANSNNDDYYLERAMENYINDNFDTATIMVEA